MPFTVTVKVGDRVVHKRLPIVGKVEWVGCQGHGDKGVEGARVEWGCPCAPSDDPWSLTPLSDLVVVPED